MVNEYMKKYIQLLVVRELKIKTRIKYHYTPTKMVKIENNDSTKEWWDFEGTKTLIVTWKKVQWYNHKYLAASPKIKYTLTFLKISGV